MKYIINLYNTISNAQEVADRLKITGDVLSNLKVIHVEDPTQEQVDTWTKDKDVKNIIPDQTTVCDDVSSFEEIKADSIPTNEETFTEKASGDTTQSTLAFTSGSNNYHYWHLSAISHRPRSDAARGTNYYYSKDGTNVDLYIMDSGVAGAKLSVNGGATQNAKTPTKDTIGVQHPEFVDNTFNNGQGQAYRVMDGGVPGLNIGSGSGIGGGGWQNEDTQGHGTYCAMFAAGLLAGIAKKSYIWSAKCMDSAGTGANSGLLSDMQTAMNAIVTHHQTKANGRGSVCNISIGVPFYRDSANININEATGDTLNEVLDDNEKIMASAGIFIARSGGNGIKNNAQDLVSQGGIQASFVTGPRTSAKTATPVWNIEDIDQPKLGVGALESRTVSGQSNTAANLGNGWYNLRFTNFSNHGNAIEISAPGKELVVKHWNATEFANNSTYAYTAAGTSYSAPMVAGVACLRYQVDSGAAPSTVKTFILDAANKPYDYQNLTSFTHPHENILPIINAIKYIDSPTGSNDNMQSLKNQKLIALRVSPYLYGIKTNSTDAHELEHGPSNTGNEMKIAREDYFMIDETTKTSISGISINQIHGQAHRLKYRFTMYCDLEPGDPNGGSTLTTPNQGQEIYWAVDSNSSNNGTIKLVVVAASGNHNNKIRVWLNKSPNTTNWPQGDPFDISSITTSDWNGKFMTAANASGVYYGKMGNFNVATASTINNSISALNGWVVFTQITAANTSIATDGTGLKLANLSGTNALGINASTTPHVTYNAVDGQQYGQQFRDGLLSDADADTINTVTITALYGSGSSQIVTDYLPIKESPQRTLFSWYVDKELRPPNLSGSGFISNTPQNFSVGQGGNVNLNLGMCWVDTNNNWLIGYQHLEADAQSYSLTGNLPSGLTLNTTTGVLTGTITSDITETNTFTITAHNVGAVYNFVITEIDEVGYDYDGTDLRIPGRVIDNWIEVKTDSYQLAVNKNYMIDSGALTGLPMNLTMPSSAKMGDTIILMDATSTAGTNSWIIDPNGLKIHTPGSGTSTWTVSTVDVQYELVYFESTRSAGQTGWIIRVTS